MPQPKLSRLELRIMEALWKHGTASVREIQETLPAKGRPAYTTVQTMLTRLEAKEAVRRARKISNAHIYEPVRFAATFEHIRAVTAENDALRVRRNSWCLTIATD
jgi:predicted transcriptional regulator